jgi:hypothetical protein
MINIAYTNISQIYKNFLYYTHIDRKNKLEYSNIQKSGCQTKKTGAKFKNLLNGYILKIFSWTSILWLKIGPPETLEKGTKSKAKTSGNLKK